jgi:broad specificity phosphatase PhoE
VDYFNREILPAADALRGDNLDQEIRVGVFGHGLAFGCLIRNLLGSDPSVTWKIQIANTGAHEFAFNPRLGWFPQCLNSTTHLQ